MPQYDGKTPHELYGVTDEPCNFEREQMIAQPEPEQRERRDVAVYTVIDPMTRAAHLEAYDNITGELVLRRRFNPITASSVEFAMAAFREEAAYMRRA